MPRYRFHGFSSRADVYGSDSLSSSRRYSFQSAAGVCVPCPRVSSLMGSRTNRPFLTRSISRSMMASSGGLISSSAELTAKSGALIVSSRGWGLYSREASHLKFFGQNHCEAIFFNPLDNPVFSDVGSFAGSAGLREVLFKTPRFARNPNTEGGDVRPLHRTYSRRYRFELSRQVFQRQRRPRAPLPSHSGIYAHPAPAQEHHRSFRSGIDRKIP